jgi:hypothetical protein
MSTTVVTGHGFSRPEEKPLTAECAESAEKTFMLWVRFFFFATYDLLMLEQ